MDQAEIAGRPLSPILRTADDIVDALRARKDALAISNEVLEELAGTAMGSCNKWLGPSREKTPTISTLVLLLGALGLSIVFVEDADAVRRMSHRWTRRNADRARDNGRISKVAIRRALPAVFAEIGRKGAAARWARMTPAERRRRSHEFGAGAETSWPQEEHA